MSIAETIGICWAASAVLTFRPMLRLILDDVGDDWSGVSVGLLCAVIYCAMAGPMILTFFVLRATVGHRDSASFARFLAGESSEQKANRLERERKDRERYIEKLERELGIGDPA